MAESSQLWPNSPGQLEYTMRTMSTFENTPLKKIKAADGVVGVVTLTVTRVYPPTFFLIDKNYSISQLASIEQDHREAKQFEDARKNDCYCATWQVRHELLPSIYNPDLQYYYLRQNDPDAFECKVRTLVQERRDKAAREAYPQTKKTLMRKVRCVEDDEGVRRTALITIWSPKYQSFDINEGDKYAFLNVTPTGLKGQTDDIALSVQEKMSEIIRISEGRNLTFGIERSCYPISDIVKWDHINPLHHEVDIVGRVMNTGRYSISSGQTVTVSDGLGMEINIKFWTSIELAGVGEIIKEGRVVAFQNLEIRQPISMKKNMLFFLDTSLAIGNQNEIPEHMSPSFAEVSNQTTNKK